MRDFHREKRAGISSAPSTTIRKSGRVAPALIEAGVRPAKSRGQNFLVQGAVADRIIQAASLGKSDEVIEIGPGLGVLTERIVRYPLRRLTLIEIDRRLAARLERRFSADPRVCVIAADFLDLHPSSIIVGSRVKVIGNLPFNVAAAILKKLSDTHESISRMVLMFQREVAARIRARPREDGYSALSAFTAMYWQIDLHFAVAPGSFHPRPKVSAEVLRFLPIDNPPFAQAEEQRILQTVRASFSAPRKMIRNAIQKSTGLAPSQIAAALERAGINHGARAETLGIDDFVRLSRELEPARQTGASTDA
ncbi:MAG TPA: 16S rRNA (adenine(1518)-N(6)/adenine(1519)-N(6))-dimethyltransferase RsmA [Candidatus Binataceae bacterium]